MSITGRSRERILAPEGAPSSSGETPIPVRIKISALWASAMFCYVYGDYFLLYAPGKLQSILDGKMAPFGDVRQSVLIFTSASMVIPSLMIFFSLILPKRICRWANVSIGLLYTAFVGLTMLDAWAFYLFLGTIDMALTLLIVWHAWTWRNGS